MPKLTKSFIDNLDPQTTSYRIEWDDELKVYRPRFSWTPNWDKLLGHSYPEGERTDGIETCS